VPALEDTCTQLVALPGMGSVRHFVQAGLQGVRVVPVTGFEHYLIFYAPIGNRIQVIRVLHAARDYPTLLG